MSEVVWNNDRRYPGPEVHPLPEYIKGVPTQPELDAMPRLFTWGELKEMICKCRRRVMAATPVIKVTSAARWRARYLLNITPRPRRGAMALG